MNDKQLLGLDVGIKRSGIARASTVARIAEPLMSVKTSELMKNLQELINRHSVDAVVIGLPRNLDSQETQQTQWVRDWVQEARPNIDRPMYWQDEALTSRLAEAKATSHKKPKDVDAFAAAIILQDFLDTPESERVVC